MSVSRLSTVVTLLAQEVDEHARAAQAGADLLKSAPAVHEARIEELEKQLQIKRDLQATLERGINREQAKVAELTASVTRLEAIQQRQQQIIQQLRDGKKTRRAR